jgi:uncharacterized membrane protein
VLAYGGAVGLILGVVELSVSAVDRIPASNTALAGIALAIVVGVPMTIAAVRTQHSSVNGAPSAFAAGVILVAWILVQMIIIREVDYLQIAALTAGVVITVLALRDFPRPDRPSRQSAT